MLKEIRIAGFGGQGVILSATVLGRAAALHENGFATMTQNFGPEARGGAASAALIISDEPVLYPYLTQPDVLVVMSQEAYGRFAPELREDGILIVEEDLVRLSGLARTQRIYGVPATRLAEELGKKMVLNVVMVGFLVAVAPVVTPEAARKAVADVVPARFQELNLKAFDRGYEFGRELLARGARPAEVAVPAGSLETDN